MLFNTTIKYQEEFLQEGISKRVEFITKEEVVNTEIKEYTSESVPVAFLAGNVEYRLLEDNLYTKVQVSHLRPHLTPIEDIADTFKTSSRFYGFEQTDTKGVILAKLSVFSNRHIIIDGELWGITGEPRYVVMTFGGGINSSTSLCIDHNYNPNIDKFVYFNAHDRSKAIEYALQIAKMRGDDSWCERIINSTAIDIIIPEAVKCNPEMEHKAS